MPAGMRDTGDSDAAFRIISSHLRLVVKIAMDFQRRWMQNVLDLIQEGNVGLMRAVNKFDPDKGIKFSYYATFWIRAYILKFIMDNWRMVKIGTTQAQRKLFYNLNKERQKLIAQGFDPSANALSERLGVTEDQIVEMQQRLDAGDVSLDLPVSDESGSSTRQDFRPRSARDRRQLRRFGSGPTGAGRHTRHTAQALGKRGLHTGTQAADRRSRDPAGNRGTLPCDPGTHTPA